MYEALILHTKSKTYSSIKEDPFRVVFPEYPRKGGKWFAYRETGPGFFLKTVASMLVYDDRLVLETEDGSRWIVYEINPLAP